MARTNRTRWFALVPVLIAGLGFAYCFFTGFFYGRETLKLTVLDTGMHPVPHAKVKYKTLWTNFGPSGELETGDDGSVLWPVLKAQDVLCTVIRDGYAILEVRIDQVDDGKYPWHQTAVSWFFPSLDSKDSKPRPGGGVVTPDVDDASLMRLSVYLPKNSDETIPAYGPMRVVHEENGRQVWTLIPSRIGKR